MNPEILATILAAQGEDKPKKGTRAKPSLERNEPMMSRGSADSLAQLFRAKDAKGLPTNQAEMMGMSQWRADSIWDAPFERDSLFPIVYGSNNYRPERLLKATLLPWGLHGQAGPLGPVELNAQELLTGGYVKVAPNAETRKSGGEFMARHVVPHELAHRGIGGISIRDRASLSKGEVQTGINAPIGSEDHYAEALEQAVGLIRFMNKPGLDESQVNGAVIRAEELVPGSAWLTAQLLKQQKILKDHPLQPFRVKIASLKDWGVPPAKRDSIKAIEADSVAESKKPWYKRKTR